MAGQDERSYKEHLHQTEICQLCYWKKVTWITLCIKLGAWIRVIMPKDLAAQAMWQQVSFSFSFSFSIFYLLKHAGFIELLDISSIVSFSESSKSLINNYSFLKPA